MSLVFRSDIASVRSVAAGDAAETAAGDAAHATTRADAHGPTRRRDHVERQSEHGRGHAWGRLFAFVRSGSVALDAVSLHFPSEQRRLSPLLRRRHRHVSPRAAYCIRRARHRAHV